MKVTVWENEAGRVIYSLDNNDATYIEQGIGDTEEDACHALCGDLSSRGRQQADVAEKRRFLRGIREAAAKYFERNEPVRTDLPSVDDMIGIVKLDKPCTEYGEKYEEATDDNG